MTQATTMNVYREADAPKTTEEIQTQSQDIISALLSSHSGDADATYAVAGMFQHFPTLGVMKMHDGSSFLETLTPASAAPANAAAPGAKGQFWLHATGIDICVATDTWLRLAGASF